MKINFTKQQSDKVRSDARRLLNLQVRASRAEVLRHISIPLRKLFVRDYHLARTATFHKYGFQGKGPISREDGRLFLDSLQPDQRVALQTDLSIAVEQIAIQHGHHEVAELEQIRRAQLDGCHRSKTPEDALAIAQVSRDVLANVVDKHKAKLKAKYASSGLPKDSVS